MKRQLVIFATASAMAAPSAVLAAAHDDGPEVYGRAHLSLSAVDYDNEDRAPGDGEIRLTNNTSAFGVRGTHGLEGDWDVVYQLESEVGWGDGVGEAFTVLRDSYLGVESEQFGRVVAGRLPRHNQYSTEFDHFVHQLGMTRHMVAAFTGSGSRIDNTIRYTTPTIADVLSFNVSYRPSGNDGVGEDDAGFAGQARYDDGTFIVVGSFQDEDFLQATDDNDNVRYEDAFALSGAWNYGLGQVSAEVFHYEEGDEEDDDATSYRLGATYDVTQGFLDGQLKANATFADWDLDDDPSTYVVGYDHFLSDQTTVYGVAAIGQDGANITPGGFDTGGARGDTTGYHEIDIGDDEDSTGVSVGMIHNF